MTDQSIREQTAAAERGSRRSWFYAVGFVGLASRSLRLRICSSARPYDGIVPAPYSKTGIDVRDGPGRPADRAEIRAGDCVVGIGRCMVNTISDASTELRRHGIGEKVPYLVRRGSCPAFPDAGPATDQRPVDVSSRPRELGAEPTFTLRFSVSLLLHRALRVSQPPR
jgi:S1-C subfamily serine protease